MKKKVFGKKLGRERDSRRALFRSLIRSLVKHGKIKTTKAKAKSMLPSLEKLISKAKTGTVANKRLVYSRLGNDRQTADFLFGQAAKSFSTRKSGFVRVTNLPRRKGDNAEMVTMEWSDKMILEEKKSVERKRKEKKSQKEEEPTLKSRVRKAVKGKNIKK